MTKIVDAKELEIQREYMRKIAELNLKRVAPPLAHVHTFGCQQNVSDGEKIKGMIAECGYGFCSSPDEADLVIFNTCAVRENAEDRVYGNLGALKNFKRSRPDMIIGVMGCMSGQQHVAERIKKSFPYVNMVLGTHALHTLPEILYKTITEHKRSFVLPDTDGYIAEGLPICRESKIKVSVPIMYGCDNFCSYCVVPYVRGRERSRDPEDILNEIKSAIDGGAKEILLLGQNVNSYGKGISTDFAQLLRKINALDGEFRICYMSSHPKDITPELIDAIAGCEKVTRHFHLPVQSGSTRVLELMNRHYTRETYLDIVSCIRKKVPDAALTSDIIVGFPGETYEDFSETLSLVREVGFDSLFTFIYSPRHGTKAALMPDPVSADEKGRWFRELLAVQQERGLSAYERYVGKKLRVLCEGAGRTGRGGLTGKTPQDVIVDFDGGKELVGSFVDVEITEALNWALLGKIC